MTLNVQRNYGTINELLVLQFDQWSSKNKELSELGLELGFLYNKKRMRNIRCILNILVLGHTYYNVYRL